ncbi:hypothetical protein A6U86_33405 [Rhizobium sp. AC27/96]|uniref:hypothetical protein n=1 Tax=Rhizobium TaxID=379 RepID=UPI0008291FFD|nr:MULTISPECIES: hypothetical protein [Rhizobium]NTF43447.1 hypothetical protein [Rhizobium rhizogenes]OCI98991.1 hypothetical protein A6U86_33405 [Rhizobium sp. AC27/96]
MVVLFKAVGGIVIAVAIMIGIWMLAIGGISGLVPGLVVTLMYAFCGAVIFTFGLMLEHLEAIRRDSARQSEMLTELLRRTPKTEPSHREAMANNLDQLVKSNFRFKEI